MYQKFLTWRAACTLLAAVLLVVIAAYLYSRASFVEVKEQNTDTLEGLGFSLENLGRFNVTAEYGNKEEVSIAGESGDEVLRLRILNDQSKESSERYISGQSLLLEAQYDSRLPPYPEFLTNKTGCAGRFLPKLISTEMGPLYLVYADGRFNYGLCVDDLIQYKVGFGIFYCPASKKLFQVEYFIGPEESFQEVESTMRSFKCLSTD